MNERTVARFVAGVVACVVFVGCRKEAGGVEQPKPAAKAETGFSFAVYGDSRSMMYLPYRADQETEARELLVDLFSLVLPAAILITLIFSLRVWIITIQIWIIHKASPQSV